MKNSEMNLSDAISYTTGLINKIKEKISDLENQPIDGIMCCFDNGISIFDNGNGEYSSDNLVIDSPMLYNKKQAEFICSNVKNGNGEYPKPMDLKSYYELNLKLFIDCLNSLEQMV